MAVWHGRHAYVVVYISIMKRLHIVLAVWRHVVTGQPRLLSTHCLSMETASLQSTT